MSIRGRRKVIMELEAPPGVEVYIAGSFNRWNATGKRLREKASGGVYETTLMLPRGKHEYKYVINGQWRIDTHNPRFSVNDLGTLNSVMQVQ